MLLLTNEQNSLHLPFSSSVADVAYVLDPMIATSGTITAVLSILKRWGVPKIHVIAVLASRKGLEKLTADHPDVSVTVSAIDEELNDKGIIIPGLGDAGNRLYKTPDEGEGADETLMSPSKRKRSMSEDVSAHK